MNILVTGSSGLIGSEAVKYYCNNGYNVIGIDNNQRKILFGNEGCTEWNRKLLENSYPDNYQHISADIRDNNSMEDIFLNNQFDLIIHAASQPSHDWAATDPYTDFTINANGTLTLLENYRKYCPEAIFIFTSTNKVYGDTPNNLPFIEEESRYELPEHHPYYNGFDEKTSIDQSKHSLFGVSKLSGDLLTQEYGKYFNLNTGIFRCGCVTGSAHSGTQQHGFLSFLTNSIITDKKYTIFGYKGKQVRDNMQAYDLVTAFDQFYKNPRKGEVYNMGGSRYSNISINEAITEIENIANKKANIDYLHNTRIGDHIWYISDVTKFKNHYPYWNYKYDIKHILKELIESILTKSCKN